ncbi:MAG: hypothetical protein H7833_20555 [Magnetococcus sp. DMHC-1]|nr:hypothetical protein [Magnetococcales bacterium]
MQSQIHVKRGNKRRRKFKSENFPKSKRYFSLLLIFGLLAGCTFLGRHEVEAPVEAPKEFNFTVAVLPFENFSNNPGVGHSISELVATELASRKVFRIQNESETRRILVDGKVDMDRLDDISLARNFAELLRVDAVLIGSVPEFSYQHGLQEKPTVGLNVQLIRAHDGLVLWHGSQALMGSGYWQRQSAVYIAQDAVVRLVDSLVHAAEPDWLPTETLTQKTANTLKATFHFKG